MTDPIRILLVEDHAGYRDVIASALHLIPSMELIHEFRTAEAALREIQYAPEPELPNLILLDLNLPGMTGLEAIPWIREYAPTTKVIILTQSDKEADIVRAITLGVEGYLLKSGSIPQIKEGIEVVMKGGATLDPAVAKYILHRVQPLLEVSPSETSILSDRELDVLTEMAEGLERKQIADSLNISITTVSFHIRNIYEKLNVQNAPAAVAKAFKTGLFKK